MRAMILAAGLGTRLRPVTNSIPKALVVIGGKPMLQHALEHLSRFGIRDVIVNVHHFPDQIIGFLRRNHNFGMNIAISDESDILLDTGGGVKKAAWFFTDGAPFVVRNVDILSDLDISLMEKYHAVHQPMATLAVRNRKTSRYFLFDGADTLCGWENRNTGEIRLSRGCEPAHALAFSGIQIMSPEIFSKMGEDAKFSLTDMYLEISAGCTIMGYPDTGALWNDIGKHPEK